MVEISKNANDVVQYIKQTLDNPPDLIIKDFNIKKKKVFLLAIETMANSTYISDFILEYFSFDIEEKKEKNFFKFLYHNIPTFKTNKLSKVDEIIYNLLSGFTIILIDGYQLAISIETKEKLNSDIVETINERSTLGPKDGFTENYQTNIGLIRKRLKTSDLKIKEAIIGKLGKSKVAMIYLDSFVKKEIVDEVYNKIKNINIDVIFDVQQIIDLITENKKNTFPNYISTERPDNVSSLLLTGRIAIVLENVSYVAIIPITLLDILQNVEDRYTRPINASFNRIVRFLAFLITILTPAIYVAMTTYNHETIPPKLLVSFSTQRSGVPFATIIEALLMIITFEILKETDARSPNTFTNSLTIVGALVLGEAAVNAGIVSPIMVIVIAITSISGLIITYLDIANGVRLWRLIFLLGSSLAGFMGILIVGFIFITNISCIKSFGTPFLSGVAPYYKNFIEDSLLLSFKNKFTRMVQRKIINPKKFGDEND